MQISRQVNRVLHDEHMHVQRLLDRLGDLLKRDYAETAGQAETQALLNELMPVLEHGLERHFRFEEEDLFPPLEEAGDGDMVALLLEDHQVLLPLAAEVLAGVRRLRAGEFEAAEWPAFRRLGLEFVERQTDHIEKEEMALLPALEDAIDEAADREIWSAYAAG